MLKKLNWAVIRDGKVRALFVTRWQAEKYIETLYNKDAWGIQYVKEEELS